MWQVTDKLTDFVKFLLSELYFLSMHLTLSTRRKYKTILKLINNLLNYPYIQDSSKYLLIEF